MSTATSTKSSRIAVEVSEDAMLATLRVRGAASPASISAEDVYAALNEVALDISKEVEERVDEFVQLCHDGKKAPDSFVVAEGTPTRNGQDECLVWDEQYAKTAAEWQEDAPRDYYSFNSIITVQKGAVIGRLSPAVQPCEGMDVTGRRIKATGSALPLELDKSIERSEEDASEVIAGVAGKVIEENNRLRMEEALEVSGDVGFETGNIDSLVEVHIGGGIPDRFEVKSQRSITVGGSIEAAHVIAGGDVVIRRGIVGRHQGLVLAGERIVTKYAADATLVAGTDLKIHKQLMKSEVCVGDRILGPAARLIGGCAFVRNEVQIANLGSEAGIPTRIVVGVRTDSVRQAHVLGERIRRVRKLIEQIREILSSLLDGQRNLEPMEQQQARELLAQADKAAKQIADDERKRQKLLKDVYIEEPARVRVSGTIYSRVTIRVKDRETSFREDFKGPVSIEKRKIKNVTEIVAVNSLSGSIKVLKHERCGLDDLLTEVDPETESEGGPRR